MKKERIFWQTKKYRRSSETFQFRETYLYTESV